MYDWLADLRSQNPCGDSWFDAEDGSLVNGCLTCGERQSCECRATENRLIAFITHLIEVGQEGQDAKG